MSSYVSLAQYTAHKNRKFEAITSETLKNNETQHQSLQKANLMQWFFRSTRWGLFIRAVGDSPDAAKMSYMPPYSLVRRKRSARLYKPLV